MNNLSTFIEGIDFAILDFIQSNIKNPFLDAVMPFITHLGSSGAIWIVIALIFLCIRKYRRTGLIISLSLILSLIVCNLILKNIAVRIRPFDINTAVNILITKPTDFSFPSGHTSASFAAAVSIYLGGMRRFAVPALIVASLIAFSRLYLYVHFPTDVLAGVILGTILAFASNAIVRTITHLKTKQ